MASYEETLVNVPGCRVVARGEDCEVRLEESDSGELFALCPVNPGSVERTEDSRRYFVLRVEDGSGKHAYVGLGFDQRSEAFDFSVALDDHRKTVERMKDPSAHGVPLTKMSDEYALKEGEKISVDISGKVKVKSNKPSSKVPAAGGAGKGISLGKATQRLATDGSSGSSSSTSTSSSSSSSHSKNVLDDFF